MMQIQYIIENDLFSKGLFFLKWWAGPSCRFNSSWLTAHLIRVWHTTEKMRFGLNVWNKRTVGDERMPPFISSVWCSSERLHWTTQTTERRGKRCTVEEQHRRLPCVIGWGWKEREGDGALRSEGLGVPKVDFKKRWDGTNDSVGKHLSSKESTQEVKDQLLRSSTRGNKSLPLIQRKWAESPQGLLISTDRTILLSQSSSLSITIPCSLLNLSISLLTPYFLDMSTCYL